MAQGKAFKKQLDLDDVWRMKRIFGTPKHAIKVLALDRAFTLPGQPGRAPVSVPLAQFMRMWRGQPAEDAHVDEVTYRLRTWRHMFLKDPTSHYFALDNANVLRKRARDVGDPDYELPAPRPRAPE